VTRIRGRIRYYRHAEGMGRLLLAEFYRRQLTSIGLQRTHVSLGRGVDTSLGEVKI
jgi:hypothetical protein